MHRLQQDHYCILGYCTGYYCTGGWIRLSYLVWTSVWWTELFCSLKFGKERFQCSKLLLWDFHAPLTRYKGCPDPVFCLVLILQLWVSTDPSAHQISTSVVRLPAIGVYWGKKTWPGFKKEFWVWIGIFPRRPIRCWYAFFGDIGARFDQDMELGHLFKIW